MKTRFEGDIEFHVPQYNRFVEHENRGRSNKTIMVNLTQIQIFAHYKC